MYITGLLTQSTGLPSPSLKFTYEPLSAKQYLNNKTHKKIDV